MGIFCQTTVANTFNQAGQAQSEEALMTGVTGGVIVVCLIVVCICIGYCVSSSHRHKQKALELKLAHEKEMNAESFRQWSEKASLDDKRREIEQERRERYEERWKERDMAHELELKRLEMTKRNQDGK